MLNRFRDMLSLTLEAYHLSLQLYNDKMQASLNGVEYYSTFDLTKLHQSVKNEAVAQVHILLYANKFHWFNQEAKGV